MGESTIGSTSFCFAKDCSGSGLVLGVDPPAAPFTVTDVHVDGLFGSGPAVFPLLLAPGESVVADVAVVVPPSGEADGRLAWVVASGEDGEGDECEVDLGAAAPVCGGDRSGGRCSAETCVGGACVAAAVTGGACEDGDPCTVGDTCVDGVCHPGPAMDCSHDPCVVGGTCVGGACVGTPVDCDDGNPCTGDSCDPARGCIHVPLSGTPCDDGDACTTGDHCDAGACRGAPIACPSDGVACTLESCVDGACRSTPVDASCGGDQCAVGACRPGDPAADARGCVTTPVGEGDACTDDGIPCTDDVCTGGACLHVPIDGRCSDAGSCTAAVCGPERADRDARGCAVGPPPAAPGDGDGGRGGRKGKHGDDGGETDTITSAAPACAEDGDPCTDDVCDAGVCVHTPAADAQGCAPVRAVFRKALGLAGMARTVMVSVDGGPAMADTGAATLTPAVADLQRVADQLDAAGRALAGKDGDGSAPSAVAIGGTAMFAPTLAQERARIAFTHVLHTPREIQSFLAIVAQARARTALGSRTSRALRARGRLLLIGTKTLKGDLRRLQRVSQTFAR